MDPLAKHQCELPLMLTVPEVAAALTISRAKAYELVRRQGFPAFAIGRRVIVSRAGLLRWIEQQAEAK